MCILFLVILNLAEGKNLAYFQLLLTHMVILPSELC